MGIKDLSKVIADHAPSAVKEAEIKSYFGRKVAVDASMCMYQFLVAVRQDGSNLQTESGETTSHLMGMFYRTIRMVDNGIKPVYVFDGKPPEMKSGELAKRTERRAEAEKQLETAKEAGDAESVERFERRLVKVTKEHNEEVKKLLRLLGIPVVEAPCEAEAQCAELVKGNKVFATATEDMDALTFGSTILLRNVTAAEAKKLKIKEFNVSKVLQELELTKEEFVDLCILLGCDYCGSIRGIGPKKAVELIKKHRSIEAVLENIDTEKYPPPSEWPYQRARELFLSAEVTPADQIELTWNNPDIEGVVAYMCGEKSFAEDRVRSALARMAKGKAAASQGRIDSFFTTTKVVHSETASTRKRKAEEEAKKKAASGKKRPLAKKIK